MWKKRHADTCILGRQSNHSTALRQFKSSPPIISPRIRRGGEIESQAMSMASSSMAATAATTGMLAYHKTNPGSVWQSSLWGRKHGLASASPQLSTSALRKALHIVKASSRVDKFSKTDVIVSPSILSANFAKLGEQVKEVELAGCDWIHVDVMDGRFVPNITIGPLVVDALRPVTELPLDVHLMIVEPEQRVPDFIKAGADIVSVHCEQSSTIHLHRTVNQVKSLGAKAGVVLNPATPLSSIEYVLDDVCRSAPTGNNLRLEAQSDPKFLSCQQELRLENCYCCSLKHMPRSAGLLRRINWIKEMMRGADCHECLIGSVWNLDIKSFLQL